MQFNFWSGPLEPVEGQGIVKVHEDIEKGLLFYIPAYADCQIQI